MIVTVSRAYGSAAVAVCRCAARELGYRLVDDELERAVATRLGTSFDVVETVADRPRPFGQRVLESLGGALPESSQPAASRDEDLAAERKRLIEAAVHELGRTGDCVIVGRLAGMILGPRPDVLRVFVHAPLPWRIERVMASLQMNAQEARAEIGRIDDARREYARDQYRVNWDEPEQYDLVLNVARWGVEGSGELIAAAVRIASP